MVNWQFYDEDKRSKPPPVYTHPKTSPSRKFFNWENLRIFLLVITMGYGVRFYNNGKDNTVKPPPKFVEYTPNMLNPGQFNLTDKYNTVKPPPKFVEYTPNMLNPGQFNLTDKYNTVKPHPDFFGKYTHPSLNPGHFNLTDNLFISKWDTIRPNIGIKTEGVGGWTITTDKYNSNISLGDFNLNTPYRDPDQIKFSNIQDIEIVSNTHFGENNGLYLGKKPPPLYKK
jgi:hypothetical protein